MRNCAVIAGVAMLCACGTVSAGDRVVVVGAEEPWQRVGVAAKPAMDVGDYLFTVSPTKDPHSITGYLIPNDVESAIRELDVMLPAELRKMIVDKLMAADAFDCDLKIYPKCFQGYYTSLDDYLEHIWGLRQDSGYAKYFEAHKIRNPAIMIDMTMRAFHDVHLHKPIDYDKLFKESKSPD